MYFSNDTVLWFTGWLGLKFYHYPSLERDRYRSAVKPVYRVGYVPSIKYRLNTITLNCLFFRASTSDLGFYLLSMKYICNSLSLEED